VDKLLHEFQSKKVGEWGTRPPVEKSGGTPHYTLVSSVKTDGLIDMPFMMQTHVGPKTT